MGNITGMNKSSIEQQLGNDFPEGEHYVGFENNKNNICYANSILQALYYCESFRYQILNYKQITFQVENPILIIQDIFLQIQNNKKKVDVLSTKKLMNYVQKNNQMFSEDYHHDSHEFLIWFLNEINDILQKDISTNKNQKTWLTDIFEGQTESQIQCLVCMNVSKMAEAFLDLSIDLEENTSLNYCIKQLENQEIMQGQNKFQCDHCNSLQEASRKLQIKKLPQTLIIHLKRFKFDERLQRLTKLNWKIAFSFDIKINSILQEDNLIYKLYAVIVHIGPGFQFGHYICFIKSKDYWFQFDDENISIVDEIQIYALFGNVMSNISAYMLFYQQQ